VWRRGGGRRGFIGVRADRSGRRAIFGKDRVIGVEQLGLWFGREADASAKGRYYVSCSLGSRVCLSLRINLVAARGIVCLLGLDEEGTNACLTVAESNS
jgi:hypothetical protein